MGASSSRRAALLTVLLVTGIASLVLIPGAVAVHDTGVFQMDGNSVDDGAGVDFDNVFAGTAGALDSDFEHDEDEPDPSHHEPSNKDEAAINGGTSGDWGCVQKQNVNNKDDIRHAYAAAYTIDGDLHVFFGADRDKHNGDANIGYWFFQTDVSCPSGGGDFSGHKTDGDLFVVSAFVGGGSISEIDVYLWEDPTPLSPESGDEFLGDGTTAGEPLVTGVDCQAADPHAASPFVCATVNADTIDVPWEASEDPEEAEFFEGGINLSELIGDRCFTEYLVETRSSQSLDANLFDLVFGDIDTCGTIIVEKQIATGSDQSQEFVFGGDAAGTIGDNEQITVTGLSAGQYTSTETVPAGWTLVSIVCDDGSSTTPSSGNTGTATATFNLEASETVKCTFTNRELTGAVKVVKTAKHAGPGGSANLVATFTVTDFDGTARTVTTDATGNGCVDGLALGEASVVETTGPGGYAADPDTETVTVADSTCLAGNGVTASFENVPLTDVTVSVNSQVVGGTASTITCGSEDPVSTDDNGDGSTTLSNLEPNSPTGLVCTIVIDP